MQSSFGEAFKSGNLLILDGGTGTELERRGVPMHDDAWSALAAVTHPEILTEIHADYIAAGADIITTNTYAATSFVMDGIGRAGQSPAVIRASIECAKEARERAGAAWIGGAISGMAPGLDPARRPSPENSRKSFAEAASMLAGEGCDLIILEMLRDVDYATVQIEAGKATGLPVMAGVSVVRGKNGGLVGRPDAGLEFDLLDIASNISTLGVDIISVMHTDLELVLPALKQIRSVWSGPVAAYPHSGHFVMPRWNFNTVVSPGEFASQSHEWRAAGCQILGGCCGITPDHIKALRLEWTPRAHSVN
ncbi:homocysteine S-methyltransferase family protein [Mesorhizobium sp. CA8]|uniref:homocysteine S-methyltransferase family protein n=1 Tax=unclassified Mesorhizobium TaxID=325217 RepID=UPI001CCD8D3E|nr:MULTISPECIES: homocysteine S-methyltransferase family protein [unclassified Mesorhizobium]MBZ9761678.1 homocysteine S-methyltransferase family protein [Mesorhizobium sp. CA8]MBZ9820568.1 homocysteine S-methyltransferase family protein [Mesorhizobium sp. CA4]